MNANTLIITNYDERLNKISYYNVLYNLNQYIKNVEIYKFQNTNFRKQPIRNKIINDIKNIINLKKINLVIFLFSWGYIGNYTNGGNIFQYFDINYFKQNKIKIIIFTADFFRLSENFINYVNSILYSDIYIIEPANYEMFKSITNININKDNYENLIFYADDNFTSKQFNTNPINKILLSGAISESHYPERYKFLSYYSQNKHKCDLLGRDNNLDYATVLNNYICCVSTSVSIRNRNQSIGFVLNKTYEICATGSLLLAHDNMFNELTRLGFIDMYNCVIYNDLNIDEKVNYILNVNNRKIIDKMRINGKKLIEDKYTKKHFIENIYKSLNNIINKNIHHIDFLNNYDLLFDNFEPYKAIYNIEIPEGKIFLLKYLLLYKYGGFYSEITTLNEDIINEILYEVNNNNFYFDKNRKIIYCSQYNSTMKKVIDKIQNYIIENNKIKKAKYLRLRSSHKIDKILGFEFLERLI